MDKKLSKVWDWKVLLVSAILYRVEVISIHTIVVYFISGSAGFSIKMAFLLNSASILIYFFHHYVLLKHYGKN